jgi:hypothetical protein
MAMKPGTIEGVWTGAKPLDIIKLKEVVTNFVTNPNGCINSLIIPYTIGSAIFSGAVLLEDFSAEAIKGAQHGKMNGILELICQLERLEDVNMVTNPLSGKPEKSTNSGQ